MIIVIIDSGLSDRYVHCKRIVFPISTNEVVPPIASGHGTAVYNIISQKCSDFAEIINFRILNIENGVSEEMLIDALSYISQNLHPDIINLSLGISECVNIQGLYNICSDLTNKGTIIVSAFDNSGSISYPAAFNNVVGVVSGNLCLKTDDFEFFDDDMVNIGAKGNLQRLAWDNPHTVFLSGNSFACAHVTSKIAEMITTSTEPITMEEILGKFKKIAIKRYSRLPEFSFPELPFDIKRAVIFPFAKEAHSMVRYADLLRFKIVDIYDTKYSVKIGSNTAHLMNDANVPLYTIKNISNIEYDSFDTLILGHLDELTAAINKEDFVTNLIAATLQHKKRIFSFDDLNKYGFVESNYIYFPAITSHNVPPQ